jgi:hypothetical protein
MIFSVVQKVDETWNKFIIFFLNYGLIPFSCRQIPYVFLQRSTLKFPLVYPILGADKLPIVRDLICSLSQLSITATIKI